MSAARHGSTGLSLAARINFLVISLVLLTAGGLTYHQARREMSAGYRDLLADGLATASMIAQAAEYGIRTGNVQSLATILNGIETKEAIAYAAFRARDGRVILSRIKEPAASMPEPRGDAADNPYRTLRTEFRNPADGAQYVDILTPILDQSGGESGGVFAGKPAAPTVVGYVQLGLAMRHFEARVRAAVLSAVWLASLAALAGVLLAVLVTRRITSPVRELADFTRSAPEEALARRISVSGSKEIVDLADSVNGMLDRLKSYHEEIERHAAELAEANLRMGREMEERRQAEGARALLHMAVEQAAETIIITDTAGTIQYVNPAFERLTGYTREEAVGQNPRILKSGRQTADDYRTLWETITRGETWTGSFVNRRRDGSLFEEVAVISPVRDGSGRITNFVAVKRDVTRENQIEEQLRQAQKMEAIGKLAGGIAHDFNNLLTVINGYSDLALARLPGDAALRKEIEEIRTAGLRAAAMTRQLLAFSRRQILQPKIIDLNATVLGMEQMLRRLIGEHIELRVLPAPDIWKVRVDPGQMEQVLLNLVVNSRDAMPSGGAITVETRNAVLDEEYCREHPVVSPGEYAMLAVTDTGCGIPADIQPRIFEPFFTTKPPGEGTGLGLSTVYGIVKQSKGYIWVRSEVGRGARFEVYLPRETELPEPETAPRAAAAEAPAAADSETLLVAEDEDLVRDMVRTILEGNGYTVLDAPNGPAALEICRTHPGRIDLLITDVVMPRMDGRTLAEKALLHRPGLKVLFMSGHAEDAIVHHGVVASGVEFIQKPFPVEALSRKVREILDAPGQAAPPPGPG